MCTDLLEEAICVIYTLTSMDREAALEHIKYLLSTGRTLESIIDEGYKIMAL